ncbi:hypothetical protein E3T46_15135 [Cryobacterium sp. Hh11]|uniref:hypothetical protein n=1 Tax=Cryobacterium sp. Hh11 TaxID=2555868 RepID=UPI00106A3A1B|nr:hypothetical protein [Cryobacterium sp. Hh11]TFD48566.1 hypothetical protein E3T46_15135 [Cryobacterium sp. Hh11]
MPKKPLPGGHVFEPRGRFLVPKSFGKMGVLGTPVGSADAQLAAAEFQHLVANAIRECVTRRSGTLRLFLQEAGFPAEMTYDRVSRILRGETMMTITDLLIWSAAFPEVRVLAAELLTAEPLARGKGSV